MNNTATNRTVTSEQIYCDFKEQVCKYIRNRINHPQDVEDVLSCVFLKVHEHQHIYDPLKAGLSTWVYVITRNTVNDYLRRQYRSPVFDPREDALVDYSMEELPVLDRMILDEQLEQLGNALERLPEREREIILLRFYYRKTSPEVADLMKISHVNVRYLQHIAIGKLKKMMNLKIQ
ncbi:sigma-70 family RNA polymerase sigma factor [Desulfosporosinus fructosivorans]|uniref:Sigma-70 family RNA polymerase sigma factor n=1 Tax=Desulfosporosinus fructosivorans TaxID=2018669 RepID=A0A4Z0R071_9FIRM|nr:sigma-70 family RNA polymerase sigma factor [Desulfosporosinus fructosivorans]TGE35725.1 sigma-70 family RNA polymerase sigma factor [Desulfosporosinus fructosivorans]